MTTPSPGPVDLEALAALWAAFAQARDQVISTTGRASELAAMKEGELRAELETALFEDGALPSLLARIAELEEALKPFVAAADWYDEMPVGEPLEDSLPLHFGVDREDVQHATLGDLRRARAILDKGAQHE